jgi:membrane protease YdiL (CAAX protease family)
MALPLLEEQPPLVVRAPRRPHPGFWASLGWSVLFVLVTQGTFLFVLFVVLLAQVMLSSDQRAALREASNSQTLAASPAFARALATGVFAQEVVSVLLAWAVIRLIVGADWKRRLALRLPGMVHAVLGLLLLVSTMVLANAVALWVKQALVGLTGKEADELEQMMKIFDSWPLPFTVLMIGVGPGIAEELWCRGFLGRGLVGRYGAIVGVLLTSTWFGLMHVYPLHQVAFAIVLGLALHFIYLTTRSLLLPMVLHCANNTLAVVNTRWADADAAKEPETIPLLLCAAALILAVAAGWALYRSRARLGPGAEPGEPTWQPDFPGVEFPPAGSHTVVIRPWPGWLPSGLVLGALAIFGAAFVLA